MKKSIQEIVWRTRGRGSGNDTLAGGAGNDYLQGGSGNDTYLFGRGAGQDYVYEYDTAAGWGDAANDAIHRRVA